MEKKEILIVTIALGNDGAERVLTELANQWIGQGHKVSIVQTGANNYGCNYKLSDQAELINIHATSTCKPIRYLQEISMLRKLLKDRPNAIGLSFIVSSIFTLCVAGIGLKNKIVVSERNNPKECPAGKLQQKLRDLSFCLADVCVYQTDEAKSYFPKKAQDNGFIIPNPINANLLPMHQGERRKAIVAACRLHPQKNLRMLFKAFSMLSAEHPDYVLELYGQGAEEEMLRQYAKELGVEDKILFMGFTSSIHQKMVDSAMYVSSSDYEGISNSMLEAMGMGVPTVVTDCPVGGSRMVIRNNENGILVPVGDAEAMYRGMKKVIEEPEFAQKISNEAFKVREQYPIEKISQKWTALM